MRGLCVVLLLLLTAGAASAGHLLWPNGTAIWDARVVLYGSSGNNCWTQTADVKAHTSLATYTNISAAISAASAGDVIAVCGGNYSENPEVNRSRLTLAGNNTTHGLPDGVIVYSNGTNGSDGLRVNVSDANVSWISVQNATASGAAGINVTAARANLTSNEVRNNFFGIVLANSTNSTLDNNTAANNSHGIVLNLSSSNRLVGNNASFNSRNGIYVAGPGSANVLSRNRASYNSEDGILLASGSGDIVNATNLVFNNSWSGIELQSSTQATLFLNQVWNNALANINVSVSGSGHNLSGNILNNSSTGLRLENSASLTLANNTFRNNTLALNASNATNVTLDASSWVDTLDTAVRLLSGSALRLVNSTLSASAGLDFNVSGGSNATLVNVTYSTGLVNVSDTSNLTLRWFLNVRVLTTELNPVENAVVNASNATNQTAFSALTNSTGYIPSREIIQFMNRSNGTSTVNDTYIPYLINATRTNYNSTNTTVNITANTEIVLVIGNDTAAPSVTVNSPTASSRAYVSRWTNPNLAVNLTYTEFSPANVTVNVTNNTLGGEVIGTLCAGTVSNSNCSPSILPGGENRTLLVTFAPLNNSAGEGYYNLTVAFFDNSSNNVTVPGSTTNLSVIVDHTGPAANVGYPMGSVNGSTRLNTTNGSAVRVNFTYNETFPANYSIDIVNATASVGFLLNSSPLSSQNASINESAVVSLFSNASDGVYNISLRVCDLAYNCTSPLNASHWLNASVGVDTADPAASNELPGASVFTTSTKPTFAINFTDLGTGVNRTTLNMSIRYTNGSLTLGTPTVDCTHRVSPFATSGTCAGLAPGALSVNTITNGFGAYVAFTGIGGQIDEIPDNTRVFITANATDYFNRTTTFSWNFTVDTTSLLLANETPSDINPNATTRSRQTGFNRTPISVNITDATAGVNISTISLWVNSTAPAANYTVTCDPAFRDNTTCETIPSGYRVRHTPTTAIADWALVNVTVNASDNAGNPNGTVFNFTVNRTIPHALNETPRNGTFQPNYVNTTRPFIGIDFLDTGADIDSTCPHPTATLKVNNTTVPSPTCSAALNSVKLGFTPSYDFKDGENVTVEANISDQAGNLMNAPFDWVFTVDASSPTASSNLPSGWTNNSTPGVQANLNDTLSGVSVATVNMTINVTNSTGSWAQKVPSINSSSGPNVTVSHVLGTFAAGTNVTVNVTASDNASNAMSWDLNWTFRVDLNDSTGRPNTTINLPANGSTTNNSTLLAFTPTDNLASNLTCFYTMDGVPKGPSNSTSGTNVTTNATNTTATLSALSAGTHNLSVTCDDQAQNRNVSTLVEWTVDATAPGLSSDSCGDPTTTTVPFSIAVDASAECRSSTANLTFENMGNSSTGTGSWSYSQTFSSLSSNTAYTVYVKCRDGAGNEASASKSCTTDAVAPSPSPSSGSGGGDGGGGGDTSTPTPTPTATPTPTPSPAKTPSPTPVSAVVLPSGTAAGSSSTSAAGQEKRTIASLSRGSSSTLKFSGIELGVEALRDLKNVDVTFAPLDRRPAGTPFPGGDVHRYFEAKGLNSSDAKVTFTFSVDRSWLQKSKVSEQAVRMLRLPDGGDKWETLSTQPRKGNTTHAEFQATSTGLSVFAIAAIEGAGSSGGGLSVPWAPVIVVAVIVLLVAALARSQRLAPLRWRLGMRLGRRRW